MVDVVALDLTDLENGYYWALHEPDATTFVVLHEDGLWFVPGIADAVNFDIEDLICPVPRPVLMSVN